MTTSQQTEQLFCTFRIDGRLYGVDILDVKEVTTEITSTRMAHTPSEVRGLVNIRGHIYLALDLRRLLGVPTSQVTSDSRLVLFKHGVGHAFGVIVDEISEIHSVPSEQIEAYSDTEHDSFVGHLRRVDLISSVCKLPGELLVVLNPRRFLSIVEQNLVQPV